jgi:predicted TIM-barrel fold metal-dependent hydrolase
MTPDYIDAHVHVWKPADVHFPYDPHYSGPPAAPTSFTPELLLAVAGTAGVKRIVLVQMSFYGTDNSYMLDAMQRNPSVFSGIAVVDHDATWFGEGDDASRVLGYPRLSHYARESRMRMAGDSQHARNVASGSGKETGDLSSREPRCDPDTGPYVR